MSSIRKRYWNSMEFGSKLAQQIPIYQNISNIYRQQEGLRHEMKPQQPTDHCCYDSPMNEFRKDPYCNCDKCSLRKYKEMEDFVQQGMLPSYNGMWPEYLQSSPVIHRESSTQADQHRISHHKYQQISARDISATYTRSPQQQSHVNQTPHPTVLHAFPAYLPSDFNQQEQEATSPPLHIKASPAHSSKATPIRKASRPGGIAFDHDDMPKIVAVHSLRTSPVSVRQQLEQATVKPKEHAAKPRHQLPVVLGLSMDVDSLPQSCDTSVDSLTEYSRVMFFDGQWSSPAHPRNKGKEQKPRNHTSRYANHPDNFNKCEDDQPNLAQDSEGTTDTKDDKEWEGKEHLEQEARGHLSSPTAENMTLGTTENNRAITKEFNDGEAPKETILDHILSRQSELDTFRGKDKDSNKIAKNQGLTVQENHDVISNTMATEIDKSNQIDTIAIPNRISNIRDSSNVSITSAENKVAMTTNGLIMHYADDKVTGDSLVTIKKELPSYGNLNMSRDEEIETGSVQNRNSQATKKRAFKNWRRHFQWLQPIIIVDQLNDLRDRKNIVPEKKPHIFDGSPEKSRANLENNQTEPENTPTSLRSGDESCDLSPVLVHDPIEWEENRARPKHGGVEKHQEEIWTMELDATSPKAVFKRQWKRFGGPFDKEEIKSICKESQTISPQKNKESPGESLICTPPKKKALLEVRIVNDDLRQDLEVKHEMLPSREHLRTFYPANTSTLDTAHAQGTGLDNQDQLASSQDVPWTSTTEARRDSSIEFSLLNEEDRIEESLLSLQRSLQLRASKINLLTEKKEKLLEKARRIHCCGSAARIA